MDEGRRDRQFDVLQLVVNGLVGDGDQVFELAIGRMDGRFLSENDSAHQLHKGGEEQFVGVLTLRGTPTIYQGEELGLTDVAIPPELVQDPWEKNVPRLGLGRDPVRTPMRA